MKKKLQLITVSIYRLHTWIMFNKCKKCALGASKMNKILGASLVIILINLWSLLYIIVKISLPPPSAPQDLESYKKLMMSGCSEVSG